jgi:colanic acid/amylovoran biosynthesis glycosyltransferase
MPHVLYVTARLPSGDGEPFIVTEVLALERQGWKVTVVPMRGTGPVVHGDARRLQAWAAPLLSLRILASALTEAVRRPGRAARALGSLRSSRNRDVHLRNLAVLPKALWLARRARRVGATHIHAHWASTPSTMAMLAARVAGIPWSITAHRWDIAENNLLREKATSASFVRVISAHGAEELREAAGLDGFAPIVLHMGVDLPPPAAREGHTGPLRIVTPARLVEKKGHEHLLEAVRALRSRGVAVHADIAGEGPLGPALRERASELGLQEDVVFLGTLPHDELLRRMGTAEWDIVVLPSVITASGQLEGIPVALIEALACGLPAVGTQAGGTPELLGEGAGILVPPGDAEALAQALERLASEPELRATLARAGRARVEERFDVDRVASELATRFRDSAGPQAFRSA